MAASAGKTELVHLIDAVYNDSVRNAFSHSDYVFSDENFRWTEAGGSSLRHGQMPLSQVNNLIDNAFSFFGMFIGVRELWLELSLPKALSKLTRGPETNQNMIEECLQPVYCSSARYATALSRDGGCKLKS